MKNSSFVFDIAQKIKRILLRIEYLKKFCTFVLGKEIDPAIEKSPKPEQIMKDAIASMDGKLQFETEKKEAREFFDSAVYNIK